MTWNIKVYYVRPTYMYMNFFTFLNLFQIKVIPWYRTAHPVLRITTRNRQQNIMAAFLAGKLAREKNGRFGKAWLGKRGGNLWQGRKRKLSESVEIVESAKTSVLSFSKCEFPVTGRRVVEQVRWSFPLKRAW